MTVLTNAINANATTPLDTTQGGSGVSNPTAHGVLIAEGASAFTPIVLSAGQVLIGTTSGDPSAATLTAGTNVTITSASGSITINSTGSGGGGILAQLQTTTLTTTYSTSNTAATNITGMSVSITPASSSNTVYVSFQLNCTCSGSDSFAVILTRGGTPIAVGTAAGSRSQVSVNGYRNADVLSNLTLSLEYLDSPATTSATTYALQSITQGGTFYVNQTSADTNATIPSSGGGRSVSTITAMEIS